MYPSQQNATDQTANFFWVMVMIIGAVLVVWWLARQFIVVPIYLIRYYEMDLIKYAYDILDPIAGFLHLYEPNINNLNLLQHHILTVNAHSESFANFAKLNDYVGSIVRYPISVALVAMAVFVHFRHGSSRFHKVHSMQTLKKQESQNWPQIQPVMSLDLIKEDINKGPWAMAKLPIDFAREHGMLHVERKEDGSGLWKIERGKAFRAFAMQLGPLWEGLEAAPIHVKALAVIFIARAEKEHDIAKKILWQIAASASSGKLDFTGVEELVQRYKNSRILKWLRKRHAYSCTFMASLLEVARTDGVLASAEFLWLKPVDRRMWYTLNSVGRQTAVVEVAGVYAHWIAEKRLKRALKTPMVKEAVNGLETAVTDILHVDEGDSWDTTNVA